MRNFNSSRTLFNKALAVIPGGVNSPVRAFRAVGGDPLEQTKLCTCRNVCEIPDFHSETQIRLVGAETVHRLRIRHARKFAEIDTEYRFEQLANHSFSNRHDVVGAVDALGHRLHEFRRDGIAGLRRQGTEVIVVTSGAIASGVARMGIKDKNKKYTAEELAPGKQLIFAATGVTDGPLMRGVRFFGEGTRTNSVIMTKATGKIRFIDAIHLNKEKKDIKIRFS